ncbi:MAG: hypothetical protein H6807_17220 [Planctomycetes bacterium]|nr:hypothetical protein [Planctomycetota bacterium]
MPTDNDLRRAHLHDLLITTIESLEIGTPWTVPIVLPGSAAIAVLAATRTSSRKGSVLLHDDTSNLRAMVAQNFGGPLLETPADLGPMLYGGVDPQGFRGPAGRIARAGDGPRRGLHPFLMRHDPAGTSSPTPAQEARYLLALESLRCARQDHGLTCTGDIDLRSIRGIVVLSAKKDPMAQQIELELRDFDLSHLRPTTARISRLSPIVHRWHEANARATLAISSAATTDLLSMEDTMRTFFGDGDLADWEGHLNAPGAATAYVEWFVRHHRGAPGAPTIIESLLATGQPENDSDAEEVLHGRLDAKTSIYRSRPASGDTVEFEDVFNAKIEAIDLGLWSSEFRSPLIRPLTIVNFGPLRFPLEAGPAFTESELPVVLATIAARSGLEPAAAIAEAPHLTGHLYVLRASLDITPPSPKP